MILPVCTYNCEDQGSIFFTRKFSTSDFLGERLLKGAADKLHCLLIKKIVGVDSKTSNQAVLSETNRSFLITGIMTRIILL